MAAKEANASANNPRSVTILAAGTGNAVSDVADRGPSHKPASTEIRIATTIGATPTATYAIEVSANGTAWVAATYADISTPTTDVATTFALTTAGVATKIIKSPTTWRWIRVTVSLNTNVTSTIDVVFHDGQRFV